MTSTPKRILAVAVFLSSVLFGMRVFGDLSAPIVPGAPPPPAQPPASAPAAVAPSNSAPAAPSTYAQPVVPSAPSIPANAQVIPVDPFGMQGAGGPNGSAGQGSIVPPMPGQAPPGGTVPAFGPAAIRAAEQINAAPPPTPPPAAPRFEPSEVVSIIANQVKIGEPRAIMHTSFGEVTIRLYSGYAPRTVQNFIELARGDKPFFDVKTGRSVQRPFYNNMIFHRVLSDYLIQTGCPFGNGRGGPGYTLRDETTPALTFWKEGIVAMATQTKDRETLPNTNGSQFFITLREMPDWNGRFSIFGEVEKGMDVVKKISRAKVGPTDRPIKKIHLHGIEIVEEITRKK